MTLKELESQADTTSPVRNLARWACALTFDDLPNEVVERTKSLFLDWLASCLAGQRHVSVQALVHLARSQGPHGGNSIAVDGMRTSAMFAALINAASSHVVEQDDLHNSSMMHPATVVFPAALAVAQDVAASGSDFIVACVIGYEFCCRFGERLGRYHYRKFHTTATTGVIGAAAAAAYLLHCDVNTTLSAIGTAGTQAAGLWQFLIDATHSKQVHTATAASNGVMSAYLARSGLQGPHDILEGARGMMATLSATGTSTPQIVDRDLGSRWSVMGSSFKWHASCRHTHPSVDALLSLMQEKKIDAASIRSVRADTYQAAVDVLTLSESAETVHQSKFSMGFVLAVAAHDGKASITNFSEDTLLRPELRSFQKKVSMRLDPDIDKEFPDRWLGRVVIVLEDGQTMEKEVDVVKGDPGWTLTRDEIESKFWLLVDYGRITNTSDLQSTVEQTWKLESLPSMASYQF